MTLDELWRYARVDIDREQLRLLVQNDPILRRIIVERDGFYCLAERTSLLRERSQRISRAHRLQKRARVIARVLRHLPFVRGLLLTGSVSADDATEGADVDLLIIVARGRIGTVFVQLAPVASLLAGRLYCPNWYMSEDSLGAASKNLYIAREFSQARNLCGDAEALYQCNSWIQEVFPNADPPLPTDAHLQRRSGIQHFLEAVLRGALGNRLEDWGNRLGRSRLRSHYAQFGLQVPAHVPANFEAGAVLGFHGCQYEASTLQAHAHRRACLQDKLTTELQYAATDAQLS